MGFEPNAKTLEYKERLVAFMDEHVYPREIEHREFTADPANLWQYPDWWGDLQAKAREAGIWNWFLPCEYGEWSPGLTNLEFAPLMEVMARVSWAPELFNCSAPDRGNMEVLAKYGTKEQQDQWLHKLLNAEIRSAYCMTEPQVASSDATNMELEIKRDGDDYVLNGRKWWATGAVSPKCKILLVMGLSNPDAERHARHSTILVPKDTPGVSIVRHLRAFGDLHSPGGEAELLFENVRVPASNMILGEGRGFEIAQGRLGPGRFQYAMTLVGVAQRSLEMMSARAHQRVAFGKPLIKNSSVQHDIARSRCEIEQCRLLVLEAADRMDKQGIEGAREFISMVKIVGPTMAENVVHRAIQVFGGMGVCQDTPLAEWSGATRITRIADGPDEVHMSQLGKMTAKPFSNLPV